MPLARTPWGLGLYGAGDLTQPSQWVGLPLVIEETTGPRRRLDLLGRALPTSPFDVVMDRQGRTHLYPGQGDATQHVTTYSEGSTRLTGVWETMHLQEGAIAIIGGGALPSSAVQSVADLRQLVEIIVKGGQRLRVEWAGIERFSSVVRFNASFSTPHKCAWELSFEWAGAGRFKPLPVEDAVDSGGRSLLEKAGDLLELAATPALMAADLADFATDIIRRIEGLVVELRDVLALYASTPSRFADVAARGVGLAHTIAAQARNLRDTVSTRSPASASGVGTGGGGAAEAAILLAIQAWLESTGRAARNVAGAAESQKQLLLTLRDPSIRTTLLVQGDTDLRFISLRQYGTPDAWTEIADANGIQGSLVSGGTSLIIPERARGSV